MAITGASASGCTRRIASPISMENITEGEVPFLRTKSIISPEDTRRLYTRKLVSRVGENSGRWYGAGCSFFSGMMKPGSIA